MEPQFGLANFSPSGASAQPGMADVRPTRPSARAQGVNATDLRLFDFTCEFQVPVGRARLDGVMAWDGFRSRIATYWLEPGAFRESDVFPQYSDFLFAAQSVHYWIYGMSQPRTFDLSGDEKDSFLPQEKSLEPVVRSALAVTACMRDQYEDASILLEVTKFLHGSRGRTRFTYEALPAGQTAEEQPEGVSSDARILNTLPYGRTYSKEIPSDGTVVWRVRKTLNDEPVVRVTVKPIAGLRKGHDHSVFDVQTLGRWALIPQPYRAYWSFDQAHAELGAFADVRMASCDLYDKIGSYVDHNRMPIRVARALDQLRFKTALLTDDMARAHCSAQISVAGLCGDESVGAYPCLLELGEIAKQIEEHYPQQAEAWLRPLVEQVVTQAGHEAVARLEPLVRTINANRWFVYGELLVEELRRRGLLEERVLPAGLKNL